MTSRRLLGAAAALAAAALVLTGCYSGSSGATGADGRQEVTMWGSWSGDQVDQINTMTSAFNKAQTKYTVKYVPQELVEQKLLTAIAGGKVPDLVLWDRYQTSLYAPKGALQSIDDRVEEDDVDTKDFYPQALSEMRYDGKLYGLPLLVDNRSLVYNEDLFAKAGLQPPTTWDELKTDAKQLTVSRGGKLQQSGFMLNDPGLFSMWLQQAGGQLLTKDGTATAFDSPEGIEVLDFWKSLMDDGVYTNGFGDTNDVFAAGEAAMKYDGPWDVPNLDKADGLKWGVTESVAGPGGAQGAVMGGFGLAIPTGAQQADGAWAFEKWWATKAENGVDFAKVSGWIPANRSSANDPFFTDEPRYAGFVKTLDYASVRPDVPGYSDVEGKALTPALEKFMSGQLTAKQALAQAAKQGDRILQENRT
ncbi:ABC transporter substrate-binding protein [Curtobacterium sp. VKM Ac-1395]|uniref:ABC transporter substrate-binding protein n=1 Tax=Curtobacterium sp. VKM Ac-1395 TaxID=2783815 RepID=UPI00188AA720|nr:ABC transporter substrate-binding protein [Curtobacterium sp. VKM Ac-1395]MBF4589409.1 ABC transporter substrate-binding protein [Curtobacterium sp. VKM Ac-1395]